MLMAIQSYRDLLVWQKSMDLVTEIYQLTRPFPHEELFGLTSQTRRAAVSVPANIAEGYGRIHRKEYLHHLSIARGSLMEVETHLQIAVRLTYLSREQGAQIWSLLQEVGRLLNGLIRSLNNGNPDGKVKEADEAYQLPEA
jgi:four helix bundle protein